MGSAVALYVPKTPSDFPNLGYWWRPEELSALANGDDVAAWPDKVSGSLLAQGTAALCPHYVTNQYNGLATVRFVAASTQYLIPAVSSAFAGDFTVIVWYKTASAPGSNLLGHSTVTWGNRLLAYVNAGNYNVLSCDNVAAANYNATLVSWNSTATLGHPIVLRRSGVNFRFHPNRRTYVQAAAGAANAWTVSRVGRGGGTAYYQGDLSELLFYSRYLSDAEISTLMEDYFYPRYNQPPYTAMQDYMTGYGAGSPVDGLSGGYGVNQSVLLKTTPWVAPNAGILAEVADDFAGYSAADAVNGKAGGVGFTGAWVAR